MAVGLSRGNWGQRGEQPARELQQCGSVGSEWQVTGLTSKEVREEGRYLTLPYFSKYLPCLILP